MNLPFDPLAIDYSKRIQTGIAPLSSLRITLVGSSGNRYLFNLYTFAPYFEPQPRHTFSPCGRVIVLRHRTVTGYDSETFAPIYTYSGQYHVFYNGNAVPDDRYAIRTAIRESHARKPSRYKQSRGRDDSVNDAMRESAMQQA